MLTLNFKSYYKTVCYEDQLVFYIVTFVYWNIVYIESCMYKSVLGKINKLQTNKKPSECDQLWVSNDGYNPTISTSGLLFLGMFSKAKWVVFKLYSW